METKETALFTIGIFGDVLNDVQTKTIKTNVNEKV